MWYFGTASGSAMVEKASAGNLKVTWVNGGRGRDWQSDAEGQGRLFLAAPLESLLRGQHFADIALGPLADRLDQRVQRLAERGQAVLDPGRHAGVDPPGDDAVALQVAQRLGQHLG